MVTISIGLTKELYAKLLLPSLLNLEGEWKAVIVTNNHNFPIVDKMEKDYPEKFIIVRTDRNMGHIGVTDIGVEKANLFGSKYICLLNDDTEIPIESKNLFTVLIKNLEELNAGSMCPVSLFSNKTAYYDGIPFTNEEKDGLPNNYRRFYGAIPKDIIETPWNNMACMLTKTEYFNELQHGVDFTGGFTYRTQVGTPCYGADNSWGRQLNKQFGLKHYVNRSIYIYHYHKEYIIINSKGMRVK